MEEKREPRRLIVTADDLEKGIFVTIYDSIIQPNGGVPYGNVRGIPIAVDAVSLPYMAGTIITSSQPIIVDTRLCTLCRVTDEYTDVIRAASKQPQPTNGDNDNGPESSGCPAAI